LLGVFGRALTRPKKKCANQTEGRWFVEGSMDEFHLGDGDDERKLGDPLGIVCTELPITEFERRPEIAQFIRLETLFAFRLGRQIHGLVVAYEVDRGVFAQVFHAGGGQPRRPVSPSLG
jgi:hypothetical protein